MAVVEQVCVEVEGQHTEQLHQQHQNVDHLAPNMAVYDDQGNLKTEILEEDSLAVDVMPQHGTDTVSL